MARGGVSFSTPMSTLGFGPVWPYTFGLMCSVLTAVALYVQLHRYFFLVVIYFSALSLSASPSIIIHESWEEEVHMFHLTIYSLHCCQ